MSNYSNTMVGDVRVLTIDNRVEYGIRASLVNGIVVQYKVHPWIKDRNGVWSQISYMTPRTYRKYLKDGRLAWESAGKYT